MQVAEVFDRLLDERSNLILVGDVCRYSDRTVDRRRHLASGVEIDVGDDHLCTVGGQSPRDGGTEACPGTGDVTSAVAVAAAATVIGGVVTANAGSGRPGTIRIGTAAGVLEVDYTVDANGLLQSVTLHRAVRRIATADLFVVPMPALVGAHAF